MEADLARNPPTRIAQREKEEFGPPLYSTGKNDDVSPKERAPMHVTHSRPEPLTGRLPPRLTPEVWGALWSLVFECLNHCSVGTNSSQKDPELEE